MKFYKLTTLVTLHLMGQNFTSAILVDNFSDTKWSNHKLNSGTDLGLSRQLTGNWKFNKDLSGNSLKQLSYKFTTGDSSPTITYKPTSGNIDLNQISTIILNPYNCPFTLSTSSIKLFDTKNNTRTKNINFSGMSSGTPFLIDLEKGYTNQGTFNRFHVNKIEFTFNNELLPFELGLESIEAVPEPFSMLTLAGGTLGFIRKKRSKK